MNVPPERPARESGLAKLFKVRQRREAKPWQRPSDHTPRQVPIHGRVKEPGLTLGRACKTHRIAAKRVRRKVDGVNRKVWLCPRCERAA